MARKLWLITLNDIRVYFSYRSALLFFFVLPVVFMWVLGQAFASEGGQEIVLPLLVVDEDGSLLSTRLVDLLEREDDIRVYLETDPGRARARFEAGEALMWIHIPQGFQERILAGRPVEVTYQMDADDTRTVALQQAVRSALEAGENVAQALASARALLAEQGLSSPTAEELLPFLVQALERPVLTVQEQEPETRETGILSGAQQAVVGQIVTWGMITFLGASTVLLNERRRGTLGRLLATPTARAWVLAGKLLSRYLLGLLQCIILLITGALLMGVRPGNPIALMAVVSAFALMGVSLGVALATVARSPQAAAALSTFTAMVLAALGGAWWPLEITPPAYQAAARLVPTSWAMAAFQDILVRNAGAAQVFPEIGALLGFAALFFLAGLNTFRRIT